jgi:hypothetical protein
MAAPIVGFMNYVVCPDDGTHLKAVDRPREGEPLMLSCSTCAKRFTLIVGRGLVEVPTRPDGATS